MNMVNPTWLPCPFCGSHNNSADKMEADDEYLRSCDDCGGRTAYYRTMEEADAAWNKPRYVAPAQPVDAETSRKDAARRLDIVATAILRGEPG